MIFIMVHRTQRTIVSRRNRSQPRVLGLTPAWKKNHYKRRLTFHVDGDVGRRRLRDVVVVGQAPEALPVEVSRQRLDDERVLRRVVGRRRLERRVDGMRLRVFWVRVPEQPRQREPA